MRYLKPRILGTLFRSRPIATFHRRFATFPLYSRSINMAQKPDSNNEPPQFRSFCPHLQYALKNIGDTELKQDFPSLKNSAYQCCHPKCDSNGDWICLKCHQMFCGDTGHRHTTDHYRSDDNHCIVMRIDVSSIENLSVYCFDCCASLNPLKMPPLSKVYSTAYQSQFSKPLPDNIATDFTEYNATLESFSAIANQKTDDSKTTAKESTKDTPPMNFFFYGTLRDDDDSGAPWGRQFLRHCQTKRGILRGYKMFTDAFSMAYPYCIYTGKSEDCIVGKLTWWETMADGNESKEDIFDRKLIRADMIEGYDPWANPDHCLYLRQIVTIELEDGSTDKALFYFMKKLPSHKSIPVKNGDWLQREDK